MTDFPPKPVYSLTKDNISEMSEHLWACLAKIQTFGYCLDKEAESGTLGKDVDPYLIDMLGHLTVLSRDCSAVANHLNKLLRQHQNQVLMNSIKGAK